MLSCKRQKALSRMQKAARGRLSRVLVFCLLPTAYCLLFSGCRRDMQDQPKAIAYRENSFYKDGTGSRPLVEGTVPRGYLREDRAYFFGKKLKASNLNAGQKNLQTPSATPSNGNANAFPDDVDMIPMPLTKMDLDRGEER